MLEDLCRLLVHIGKAFLDQLVLAVEVTVQCPGGYPRQIADILDPHPFQAVLPHSLHRGGNNPGSGVIQRQPPLSKNDFVP